MTRLNIVLLLAVMLSALYLVQTQYQSRRLVTELDRATAERNRLHVELQRLQVEKRAQATPARVEKLARDQLKMKTSTPAVTHYVRDPAGQSNSAAAVVGVPASAATPVGGAR